MKAIVRRAYGGPDVLRMEDVPTPVIRDNEVLVKVHAAASNAGDWHLLRGTPWPFRLVEGLFKPKHHIIGTDIAGRVDAVGSAVTQFRVGDDVFGELARCGFGGYAEYAAAPETNLAPKPVNVTYEEAAALPTSGMTALQGLRKGNIRAGQRVLINGASGGVGSFAVQIAKTFSTEVTAVCSTRHVNTMLAIGADYALDYHREDVADGAKRYDLILAANGDRSIWDYKRALADHGTYVMSGGSNRQLIQTLFFGPFLSRGSQHFGNLLMTPSQQDLIFLKGLVEAGKVKPVIDRRFALADVPEAVRYIETGHAAGKVVISIA
jgi:NADPH:quinone reductase-like Zn-dependent oxidoreductase